VSTIPEDALVAELADVVKLFPAFVPAGTTLPAASYVVEASSPEFNSRRLDDTRFGWEQTTIVVAVQARKRSDARAVIQQIGRPAIAGGLDGKRYILGGQPIHSVSVSPPRDLEMFEVEGNPELFLVACDVTITYRS